MSMRITFLGTGASEGIPVYGCRCPSCELARMVPRYRRVPTSLLVQGGRDALLIDVGTIRPALYLSLNSDIELHAILLSHWHHDHYAGLYVLRWSRKPLTLVHPPGGDPEIMQNPINIKKFIELKPYEKITLGPFTIETIPLNHTVPTLGYLITGPRNKRVLTLFDTKLLDAEALDHVRGKPDIAIVDSTYSPGVNRPEHNNVDEAITLGSQVGPGETILTHVAHHNLPHNELERYVTARGATLSHDYMTITL